MDLADQSLRRTVETRLAGFSRRIESLGSRVRQHRPDQILALHRQKVGGIAGALTERFQQRLRREKDRLTRAGDMLRLLSPEQTLSRGYTITTTADGKVIRSVADAASGGELRTRLRDGAVISVVSGSTQEKPQTEKKRKPRKA